jgi:molecular chaperone Hsp33
MADPNLSGNLSGVLPFVIDAGPGRQAAIRGRLAKMDHVVNAILGRHDYPLIISKLAAESVVLATCLASTMNYDGIFTLQAKGDGMVKTLLADVTTDGAVRAYMGYDQDQDVDQDHDDGNALAPMIKLMGTGHLAFTVDQGKKGRYQGIVPIEAQNITDVALRYFRDSEQIDTALMLAADYKDGSWHATGLLLQRIPETGGNHDDVLPMSDIEEDIWHTACTLMSTLERTEMLDHSISAETLVHRLFHELDAKSLPRQQFRDQCRCSPERAEQIIQSLTDQEKRDLADEDNKLVMSCEFCKSEWVWDAISDG